MIRISPPRLLPLDAASRLLFATGATSSVYYVVQGLFHVLAPERFDLAPEAGTAGVVLLMSMQVYDWLRRREARSAEEETR